MDLATFWFVLLGVLWTGYLVLEGFDFGVGMLLPVLGGKRYATDAADAQKRRRVLLNTIGPVWDGNEVWVLTAGGATFAAFPHWYATLFSGFYLPLLVILVALIVRNLGFEYRHKREDARWKARWDQAIFWGSLVPALLWGVALTNIVRGVPIDAEKEFTGNVLTLLNPMSLLGGLVFVALFVTHGAIFVALKTDGQIRLEARLIAQRVGAVAAVLAVVLLLWLGLTDGKLASWVTTVVAAVALLGALAANRAGREGWAFIGTATTIAMSVATYFLVLFPNVMPSTTNPTYNLTIDNASSTEYTLKVMTIVALVFTPIVLLYQGWTYWVFRKRLTVKHIPDDAQLVGTGS
ncbi:cytochrome d ubiquinol oxidase subunit II [Intrasporangium flavum]|uniref:cytochrome d ubiquinol oxidase subunit II n=1 Tax=Intrasporangium flavum TaxID=1428657 RepID=UPI00096EB631|nr:cytochrome d ubiquinol oxidase subunit II [Intrasporangium flavum]